MSDEPRAVFLRLLDGVTGRRGAAVADLYAKDAVVTHPFDLPQASVLRGRDELRAHFAASAARPRAMEARNVIVHRTEDPEVVIGEFEYHGHHTDTGETFTYPGIFVVRVRDGLIVESRDYANHAAVRPA